MAQAAASPFKQPKLAVNPRQRFDPPEYVVRHSSSPTKRSVSRSGLYADQQQQQQLSPTKLRSRSPEKDSKIAQRLAPREAGTPWQLTPDLAWSWLRFGCNVVLALIAVIVLFQSARVIRNDVRLRVEKQSAGIVFEIEECARNYMRNKCMPGQRVPVLNDLCSQWEKCMNMNPEKVLHSKLFAEAFSEAIGSFLGMLSIRTMVFLVGVTLGVPVLVNCLGPRKRYHY